MMWKRRGGSGSPTAGQQVGAPYSPLFVELLADQYKIETDRLQRYISRLGQFQANSTLPLVVLGVVAAVGDQRSQSPGCVGTVLIVLAALALVGGGIVALWGSIQAGSAAMSWEDLDTWDRNGHGRGPDSEVQEHLVRFRLNVIKGQEDKNKSLRRFWGSSQSRV